MAKRKRTSKKRTDLLPGDDDMARIYRAAAKDLPPTELDTRIIAEARHAVAKPKVRGPFVGRWAIPFSTAAVIVLSVGVVMLLTQQGAIDKRDEISPPLYEAPPQPLAHSDLAATPASLEPAPSSAKAPAKLKRGPTDSVQGVASSPAALSAAPEEKRAERTKAAPATAPMQRARMSEERDNGVREDIRSQDKLTKETIGMGVTADVVAVQATGQPGAYQFNVGIRSPDQGCTQYADWWEVLSKDGKLLYRRVLLHSHVDEQPFTRSGGPVPIQPDTIVWIRAHMNTVGYGGIAFLGSLNTGFLQAKLAAEFAADLAKQAPLPDGCDF